MSSLSASQTPEKLTGLRPLRLPLVEIWRWLLILSLPLNQVLVLPLSGIYVNLSDLLAPLVALVVLLLVADGHFRVRKYLLASSLLLVLLIIVFLFVAVYLQGGGILTPAKVALGYLSVFMTYFLFTRVSAAQARRFLVLLAWAGAVVAVVSILANSRDPEGRLDSILWGRTNVFGASLIVPVAAGCISFLLYRTWSVLPAVAASLLAIALTQSRGTLLVLAAIVAALLVVQSRRPLRSVVALLVAGLLAALLFAGFHTTFRSIGVIDRFVAEYNALTNYLATGSEFYKRLILSGRLYLWESAIDQIRESPWSGNAVRLIFIPRWEGSQSTLVDFGHLTYHSWALNTAAGYGLIVLALNVLLLLTALSPYARKGGVAQRMVRVVLVGLILYGLVEPMFEGGFFNLNTVSVLFWILAGIGTQLPDAAARPSRPQQDSRLLASPTP